MINCKECENKYWKQMYITAVKRFDDVIMKLTIAVIIAFTISVACLITTICALIRTQNFVSRFEYVEETSVEIEQDSGGANTAIIGSGVNFYGTKDNNQKEKLLEKGYRESNRWNKCHCPESKKSF